MRLFSTLAAGCVALALPLAALADKPAHAGQGNGKGHVTRADKAERAAPNRAQSARGVTARACPPGLAKKDPACLPPGQARKVGDIIDLRRVHVVTRPGLYGVRDAPSGQRYAIVNGHLMRVDSETGRILSILRVVEAILD